MSNSSKSPAQEDDGESSASCHPYAPSHELFDISTTVDPSYVISLIRKLLPLDVKNDNDHGIDARDVNDETEGHVISISKNGVSHFLENGIEAMDTLETLDGAEVTDNGLHHQCKQQNGSVKEEAWEECGCILWDLAASRSHAELMVENLVLEVILATLSVSQSVRVTEISLGILGNLACHDISRKLMASTNRLIDIIVGQLFLDDTPCLCEACRLLTLCLQGSEGVTWAKALQSEHILNRVLWIAENTLNLQLLEKIVSLLLAISESQLEVAAVLQPPLLKLGFPSLMINLLAFEMSKLSGERVPERFCILDLILRTIEALSVIDDYSQQICCSKDLVEHLNDLIKLPDKIEVANSCVTAAVLMANILTDASDLAVELSHEAHGALWSIVARILIRVQESKMSTSHLHQYVSVLAGKSDLIEELLLDYQLNDSNKEQDCSITSSAIVNARTLALKRISSILLHWKSLKDLDKGSDLVEEHHLNEDVNRLLDCCGKYAKFNVGSSAVD